MRSRLKSALLIAGLLGLMTAESSRAETAAPEQDRPAVVIPLGASSFPIPPGTRPSESEHFQGKADNPDIVWDVTMPTIQTFLPANADSLRKAVIILPGGGGRILSFAKAVALARSLQNSGVVGIVLKYRTQPLNLTPDQLAEQLRADPRIPPAPIGEKRTRFEDINAEVRAPSPYRDMQLADVVQAVRLVREKAPSLGVDPSRIMIAGQSNGGILVSEYLAKESSRNPIAGAALLYGAPPEGPPPSQVPVYLAAAMDDALTIDGTIAMFVKWKAAGMPVELHAYQRGGHGFRLKDSSGSASWTADFTNWVTSQPQTSPRP